MLRPAVLPSALAAFALALGGSGCGSDEDGRAGDGDDPPEAVSRSNQIVFVSNRAGRRGLYAVEGERFGAVALGGPAGAVDPAISPDGERIAVAGGVLRLVDGLGRPLRRLAGAAQGARQPAWSPDGARLAFVRRGGVWRLDLATGRVRRLSPTGARDAEPAWSPDGRRLAFTSRSAAVGDEDVWLMSAADGSARQRLAGGPGTQHAPDWHPDGSRVALASDRGGQLDVVTVPVDGGPTRRLTFSPSAEEAPAWSPDGSRVAFASRRDGDWEVYAADGEDGSRAVRLTRAPGFDGEPDWG